MVRALGYPRGRQMNRSKVEKRFGYQPVLRSDNISPNHCGNCHWGFGVAKGTMCVLMRQELPDNALVNSERSVCRKWEKER